MLWIGDGGVARARPGAGSGFGEAIAGGANKAFLLNTLRQRQGRPAACCYAQPGLAPVGLGLNFVAWRVLKLKLTFGSVVATSSLCPKERREVAVRSFNISPASRCILPGSVATAPLSSHTPLLILPERHLRRYIHEEPRLHHAWTSTCS